MGLIDVDMRVQSGTMRREEDTVVEIVTPREPSKDTVPDTSPESEMFRAVVSLSAWWTTGEKLHSPASSIVPVPVTYCPVSWIVFPVREQYFFPAMNQSRSTQYVVSVPGTTAAFAVLGPFSLIQYQS